MLTYHRFIGIIRTAYQSLLLLSVTSTYRPSTGGVSEAINWAGISSRTKSLIPAPLLLWSSLNGALKPLTLNWFKIACDL